jgi:hypothetical protein
LSESFLSIRICFTSISSSVIFNTPWYIILTPAEKDFINYATKKNVLMLNDFNSDVKLRQKQNRRE